MALDTIVVDYQLELGNLKSQISDLANQFKTLESSGKKSAESVSDAYRKEGGIVNNLKADIIELEKAQSKTNNPADVAAYTKKLEESRNKMKELTTATKEVQEQNSKLGDIVKEAGTKFAAAFAVEKVVEFGKASLEAYDEAAKGEAKLLNALGGRKDVQERLIKQADELQDKTGVKNDTIVQQQAFLAAQGRTEDQIKKTITAALQYAAATGKDLNGAVQELDATFEGSIGRLGRRDKAFKDMTQSQLANGAAIDFINDKYKGFAETAGNAGTGGLTKLANAFNDLMEILGGGLAKVLLPVADGLKGIVTWITNATPATEKLTSEFEAQSEKVKDLEKNVAPLLDRYDTLKSKSSLNKDEQAELKKIIEDVTAVLPSAATAFDKYGKAIGLSSDAARQSIQAEKDRLAYINKQTIESHLEDIKRLTETQASLTAQLNTRGEFQIKGTGQNASTEFVAFTDQQLNDLRKKLDDVKTQINGANADIKKLKGETDEATAPAVPKVKEYANTLEDLRQHLKDVSDQLEKTKLDSADYATLLSTQKDLQDKITIGEGKQTDAQKKANEEKQKQIELQTKLNQELNSSVAKAEADPGLALKLDLDANLAKVDDDYKSLNKTADNLAKINEIKKNLIEKYNNDISALGEKQVAEDATQERKILSDKEEAIKKKLADDQAAFKAASDLIKTNTETQKNALAQQYAAGVISKTQYEKGIRDIDSKSIDDQIAAAKAAGVSTVELEKAKSDAIIKENERIADKKKQLHDQEVDLAKQAGDAAFDIAKNLSQGRLDTLDKEHQNELDKLDKQKAAKKISDKEYTKEKQKIDEDYNKKASAEKTKQAKLDKEKALFDIAINTASGIIKALPDPVLAGIVAAAGIVEASVVASKPIPKFARGTEYVKGGTRGQDSVHAMLMPYEAVIPAKENERHHDAVKSILADKHDKDYVSVKKYNKIRENLNYYMAEGKKRETDAAAFREMNYKLQIIQKNQFDTSPIVQAISRPQQLDARTVKALGQEIGRNFSNNSSRTF